jgi:hypothetical protein
MSNEPQHDQQLDDQQLATRVTSLDVVEQQLSATIESCKSAIRTVQLLRAQLDSAREMAEQRRKAAQEAAQPKRPATFGSRRRTQEQSHGDEQAT